MPSETGLYTTWRTTPALTSTGVKDSLSPSRPIFVARMHAATVVGGGLAVGETAVAVLKRRLAPGVTGGEVVIATLSVGPVPANVGQYIGWSMIYDLPRPARIDPGQQLVLEVTQAISAGLFALNTEFFSLPLERLDRTTSYFSKLVDYS